MSEKQRWIKLGLIFAPSGVSAWARSHAALPAIDVVGDVHRVYFSSRDLSGRSQIGYFDITLETSPTILRVSEKPVIAPGPLGAFDDSGVTTSWIVDHEGKKYHYYSGWSLGVTVPFYFYVGLALSEDGGETYERASPAPILERNEIDPYLTASPCVMVDDGKWRMWYVSGTGWGIKDDRPRHYYHVKYAESDDGVYWNREGVVCIDYQSSEEHAIARPCVIKEAGLYKMWYSYRGNSYRIGYAESVDGIKWTRKDSESGIDVSGSGWDSEMIEYAYVFESNGVHYMLYNGNDYGRTGIGLAVLDGR
jgi:predicted GH43/DUF377 family glycosyl hydrolase